MLYVYSKPQHTNFTLLHSEKMATSNKTKLKKLMLTFLIIISIFIALLLGACTLIAQPGVKPISTQVPDVSTENLIQHVRQLSETYIPRSYTDIENLNATADYITQQLQQHSERVSQQEFQVDGNTYRNIVAYFGPQQGERIIVGAHYDACGLTPGADDNASGIAGLLELARLLKEHPPTQPIGLVAYTLEEPPFFRTDMMGSAVHAKALTEQGQKVKLMIAIEMIGYFSDEADSQQFPLDILKKVYSDKGNFIGVISNMDNRKATGKVKSLMMGASDLPVYSLNAPAALVGIDFSDHRNYWTHHIPAVMVTDTAFYRNKQYHKAGDTWDKLDYIRMAKVVQGIFAAIQNF